MMKDILKLSISDRLLMMEAIWESISINESQVTLSNNDIELLELRLKEHLEHPSEGSNWNEVKSRLENKF